MTRSLIALIAITAVAALAACEGSGGDCSATVPSSCPSAQPSYKSDVAPLLQTYCTKCHAPGGEEEEKPLDTYKGAAALKGDIQSEVSGCDMPPSDEKQPTAAERDKILAWVVCGAQDN